MLPRRQICIRFIEFIEKGKYDNDSEVMGNIHLIYHKLLHKI